MPIGNPCLAVFLNLTLFEIRASELLSGDIRGRREGRGFSRKDQDEWNSQQEKKSERNVGDLWAEKRIIVRKVGYPGNGPSVTWTVDVWGVACFLIAVE